MNIKSKPKVAIIGVKGLPATGGAARANEAMIKYLAEEYDITVYEMSTHKSEVSNKLNYTSISFKGSKLKRLNTFLYYLESCLHALFVGNYEIVHTQHLYSGFIVPFLRLRFKVVNTIRGIIPPDDNKWNNIDKLFFKLFEKISLNFANISVSVSYPQIPYLKQLTNKDIIYIPNGVDVDQVLLEKRKEIKKEFILFSAARIIKLKGCHTFLKALRLLNYKGKIKIIGSLDHVADYKNYILELSKDLGVEFKGLIPNKEHLFEELLSAKYFVFPSTKEGLSNMLLEVASLNIPIICSDIEENKAVFSEDEVLYFKTEDENDLAEKILYAENNQSDMASRALRALDRLQKDYRWENISQEYAKLYNKLISSN